MVANLMIQVLGNVLYGYSLIDIVIGGILISAIIAGIMYFPVSRKKSTNAVQKTQTEVNGVPFSPLVSLPQITVVFQKDISDEDDLCKEIADMYVSNRVYYYAGKNPPTDAGKILSEKENDVFVKYEDIDFSSLKFIDA